MSIHTTWHGEAQGHGGWPEFDSSLLEDGRGAVPAFPLDLLPQPWRDWVADTARSAGVPVDYVAQAVLGALGGVCGAGVAVRVTPTWSEPLVLWQALVGPRSSGKSPALAPVRGLLGTFEDELRAGSESPPRLVVSDPALEPLADAIAGNPGGVVLWRDGSSAWLARIASPAGESERDHWLAAWAAGPVALAGRRRDAPRQLARFPVGIVATLQPDRLVEALGGEGDGMAARFLYAWPDPPPFCPFGESAAARDDEALVRLRRIARRARTPEDPLVLGFDARGVAALDEMLAGLHAERRDTEGLEAAWLGKGRGTVARLAGALELLAWSGIGASGPPGALGREQVEAAARLWLGYFRPHARAVFEWAGPTDRARRVRRVLRWLRVSGRTEVSREDIRRDALVQTVAASEADQVIYRLRDAGALRPAAGATSPRGGRPALRWQVHPALLESKNG